jgi:NADPH:quinone reductase-like Zn-dependent oxidoreductase
MGSITTQKAFVIQSLGIGKLVTGYLIPSLRPDHMLVKVKAVFLNPTDRKHLDLKPCPGCVSDVEFATVVEQSPEGNMLKQWKVGDRVEGTVHRCEI